MTRLLIPLILLSLTATLPAFADSITYTVDPSRSTLTASGTIEGQKLESLTFGSTDSPVTVDGFTISYDGQITSNRDFANNTMQITSGNIAADYNNAFSSPPPTPSTPANYSFFASPFGVSSPGSTGSLWSGNIRNLSFSPSSSIITSPASFDASLISAIIDSGQLDDSITYFTQLGSSFETDYSSLITGNLTLATGIASLLDLDGIETLTIPIETDLTIADQSLALHLSGNIVATATVPEPATLTCLSIPTLLILLRRPRKNKKV